MKLLIIFIVLSIVNVIFSTIRSIATIKGGKMLASLTSGGYFAFYNVMLIYTVMDFPMWQKCIITFGCNVVGVWIVKYLEMKMQKDKLWKVEATIPSNYTDKVAEALALCNISYNNFGTAGGDTIFNIFCETQAQSLDVKNILKIYKAKYFVSESKTL